MAVRTITGGIWHGAMGYMACFRIYKSLEGLFLGIFGHYLAQKSLVFGTKMMILGI